MDIQILLYFTQTTITICTFIILFFILYFFQVSNGDHFLKALPVFEKIMFEILYLKMSITNV